MTAQLEAIAIDRADALNVARYVKTVLDPFCEGVIEAGSLRRGCEQVGDVEIVCVPRLVSSSDLFGEDTGLTYPEGFLQQVGAWERVKGYPSGKYTRRLVHGSFPLSRCCQLTICEPVPVDLFMVRSETWAMQLFIRTGPADYVKRAMVQLNKLGYSIDGGEVRNHLGGLVELRSEADVFRLLGWKYRGPEERD